MGRAGALPWTLECVTRACAASLGSAMLIGATASHTPFLPEMAAFGRQEPASQVPEMSWLLSNH